MAKVTQLPFISSATDNTYFVVTDNNLTRRIEYDIVRGNLRDDLEQLIAAGPQGPQGNTGPQGPTGPTGPRGDAGPTGPSGGPQGPQGLSGFSGFSGSAGIAGVPGVEGASGFSGFSGPAGGPTGPSGFSGYSGVEGTSGYSGIDGISGYSGYSGSLGNTGPQGPSGPQGPRGDSFKTSSVSVLTISTGSKTLVVDTDLAYIPTQNIQIVYDVSNFMQGAVASYNSTNGILTATIDTIVGSGTYSAWEINLAGVVTAAGPQGPQGLSGFSGYSGPSGWSGTSGYSGYSGTSGYSGYSGATSAATSGFSGYSGNAGQGLFSRADITTSTAVLSSGTTATSNLIGYKSYLLSKVVTTYPAWVRIYSDSTSRTNDETRSEQTDPLPGTGILAEVITTSGSLTQLITPGVYGFNNDVPTSSTVYLSITNKDTVSRSIDVTLTILQLEI